VKWQSILRHIIQDYALTGFGAWIIWKQVYAQVPNAALAAIGFACMFPAARAAVLTILSAPGQSSESPPDHSEQQSRSYRSEGNGELNGREEKKL
jgi:hypothetical protein